MCDAGNQAVYQEKIVTDVRQFTTLNLMPVLDLLQKLNIENEKENVEEKMKYDPGSYTRDFSKGTY